MRTGKMEDTIDHLSFSHDGKKLLFDRCRNNKCQIQVYDLDTGELGAYKSPPDEQWTMARYSYDGTRIVFSTIPVRGGYLDLSEMQIAVMNPDGGNMRRITTGPGAKIHPTFSHSGTKILYARAGYTRERGRTPAADFDAWEVNLATGKERRLTHYKFFSMSYLTYFPDDKRFLCWGVAPASLPGVPENDRDEYERRIEGWRYGANNIYALREGMTEDEPPYVIVGDEYGRDSQRPLLSKDGNRLVFESQAAFYLYSPEGNHRRIGTGGSIDSAAISPDGEYLGYTSLVVVNIKRIKDGSHQIELFLSIATTIENWDSVHRSSTRRSRMIPDEPSRVFR